MNPKSKLWVIPEESLILMNSTFAKLAKNTFNEEYTHLQKVKQENPGYKLSVRQIKRKPNKNTYKGLTYDRMREYIILTTEDFERIVICHFKTIVVAVAHFEMKVIDHLERITDYFFSRVFAY